MRLKEFTKINEDLSGAFPFKVTHLVRDIASKFTGKNPEKHIARKFKELQTKWGDDFDPYRALRYIAQVTGFGARDIREWLRHSGLMQ